MKLKLTDLIIEVEEVLVVNEGLVGGRVVCLVLRGRFDQRDLLEEDNLTGGPVSDLSDFGVLVPNWDQTFVQDFGHKWKSGFHELTQVDGFSHIPPSCVHIIILLASVVVQTLNVMHDEVLFLQFETHGQW